MRILYSPVEEILASFDLSILCLETLHFAEKIPNLYPCSDTFPASLAI